MIDDEPLNAAMLEAAAPIPVEDAALYSLWHHCWDACQDPGDPYGRSPDHQCYEVIAYPITKTTATRIYFRGGRTNMERERTYFVERAKFNDDGAVWHRGLRERLHLASPEVRHRPQPKSISELRREMAAAHPDRGGDRDAFMAARGRYLAAKEHSDRGAS